MKITVTLGELMDRGAWLEACELLGLNGWALKEGLASDNDEVTLTTDQARQLGLLDKEVGNDTNPK